MKALTLCLLTAAASAQSPFQVIDQQPDQVGGSVADLSSPQYIGDGYRSRGAGELLTGITVWGAWAGTKPTTDMFTIRVHSNTLLFNRTGYDVPLNPPIATMQGLSPLTVTATGKSLMSYDLTAKSWGRAPEYKLVFVFPKPVQTMPGCLDHWISLASESGTAATFNWGSGAVDPRGGSNPNASYTQSSGAWSPPAVFRTKNFAMELLALPAGTSLCVTGAKAGATATISISEAPGVTPVVIAASFTGAGPVPSPWGQLLISPPYALFPMILTDAMGNAQIQAAIPAGTSKAQFWLQALDGVRQQLTNGYAGVVQ